MNDKEEECGGEWVRRGGCRVLQGTFFWSTISPRGGRGKWNEVEGDSRRPRRYRNLQKRPNFFFFWCGVSSSLVRMIVPFDRWTDLDQIRRVSSLWSGDLAFLTLSQNTLLPMLQAPVILFHSSIPTFFAFDSCFCRPVFSPKSRMMHTRPLVRAAHFYLFLPKFISVESMFCVEHENNWHTFAASIFDVMCRIFRMNQKSLLFILVSTVIIFCTATPTTPLPSTSDQATRSKKGTLRQLTRSLSCLRKKQLKKTEQTDFVSSLDCAPTTTNDSITDDMMHNFANYYKKVYFQRGSEPGTLTKDGQRRLKKALKSKTRPEFKACLEEILKIENEHDSGGRFFVIEIAQPGKYTTAATAAMDDRAPKSYFIGALCQDDTWLGFHGHLIFL